MIGVLLSQISLPLLTALTLLLINCWLLVYLKKRLVFSASFRRRSTLSNHPSNNNRSPAPTKSTEEPQEPKPKSAALHTSLSQQRSDSLQPNSTINMDVLLLGCVALYFFTQFPTVIYNLLEHLTQAPLCLLNDTARKGLQWVQPIISTLSLVRPCPTRSLSQFHFIHEVSNSATPIAGQLFGQLSRLRRLEPQIPPTLPRSSVRSWEGAFWSWLADTRTSQHFDQE